MSAKDSSKSHAMVMLMEHRDALFAYVLACVRSHVDVDDILQNVSVAVIESDTVPQDSGQFLAWTREIARRRILEHFRTSKRLLPVDLSTIEQLTEAASRIDSRQTSQSRRDALLSCIEKLPPESRQLLAARYDDSAENSTAVLSQKFGRSEQGVMSLLYRLRQVLRDCVERQLKMGET